MTGQKLKKIIHGRVHIQIGKKGINTGVVEQIKNRFKNTPYLKIRFLELHLFDGMEQASEVLASKVNAKVMDIRGKTCVLRTLRND